MSSSLCACGVGVGDLYAVGNSSFFTPLRADCRQGIEHLLPPGSQLHDVQHPHPPLVCACQAPGVARAQGAGFFFKFFFNDADPRTSSL